MARSAACSREGRISRPPWYFRDARALAQLALQRQTLFVVREGRGVVSLEARGGPEPVQRDRLSGPVPQIALERERFLVQLTRARVVLLPQRHAAQIVEHGGDPVPVVDRAAVDQTLLVGGFRRVVVPLHVREISELFQRPGETFPIPHLARDRDARLDPVVGRRVVAEAARQHCAPVKRLRAHRIAAVRGVGFERPGDPAVSLLP